MKALFVVEPFTVFKYPLFAIELGVGTSGVMLECSAVVCIDL